MGEVWGNFRTRMERNIAYSVLPDGSFAGLYAKSQLVPFGEFIPYQQYLPSLGALHMTAMDMVPGGRDQAALPATPEIGKVGMMICYESTYPRFSRQQVRAGATVLAVITDDTWFGRTAAAKQHLAMSALRAVETDRFVVRSAATGISAIFAPDGTMLADAPLFRQAIVEQYIAPLHDTTLFVRYGDWLVWVGIVLLLVAVFG
jgi:apolipoprotein N-acyltransferase